MELIKNYINKLIKSYNKTLLIEINQKDLSYLEKKSLEELVLITGSVFNNNIKDETNLIYINGNDYNINNCSEENPIILLDSILGITSDSIQVQKNINILKSTIKGAISYFTGGLLKDSIGKYIDYGVEELTELLNDTYSDVLEYATEEVDFDLTENILNQIITKVNDTLNESSSNLLDELLSRKLKLSYKAKKKLHEVSLKFKDNLTPISIFNIIIELILTIAIDSKKIIFINNPHKLDNDSLAILSLFFSFAKNMKDKDIPNKHLGLSVVYCFSDEEFQPYQELKDDKYKISKKLLDEQRRFIQRYAMLERPSSDIPNIAVKSSTFVGREEELKNLMDRFELSENDSTFKNLEVIVADPGVGKTKLVEKHLKQIRESKKDRQKIIQLTLLNQVGHSSVNTGLTSLKDSILKEATRLVTLKTMESKLKKLEDKALEFAKNKTIDVIEDILGINNIFEVTKNVNNALNHDIDEYWLKQNSSEDLNNKNNYSKEEEFEKIIKAILELQELSDESLPIILFIDDIQWIDDSSAEFILKYFTKADIKINPYLIATQRRSDATTSLKLALENKTLNKYKISLLQQIGITIDKELIIPNPENVILLNIKLHFINGLNEVNLTKLISLTIDAYYINKPRSKELNEKDKILAKEIIEYLNDNSDQTKEVNTLFAIETINMLCDEKLYSKEFEYKNKKGIKQKSKIKNKLILQNPLRYNENIVNFKSSLPKVFKLLKASHEEAFEDLYWEKDKNDNNIQKFNLMAYAVLEERLHILKEYFEEYGNAAVNTLLLSSLLGAPFSSDIVKNVIKAISATEEPLLQPLKEECKKQSLSILETFHYEIIEEVYEILSRYTPINSTYSYKHNLLKIFLDKQFEYKLNTIFIKNKMESKNKFFELILDVLNKTIKNYYKQEKLDGILIRYMTSNHRKYLIFLLLCKNRIYQSTSNLNSKFTNDYINNLFILYSLKFYELNHSSFNEALSFIDEIITFNNSREHGGKEYYNYIAYYCKTHIYFYMGKHELSFDFYNKYSSDTQTEPKLLNLQYFLFHTILRLIDVKIKKLEKQILIDKDKEILYLSSILGYKLTKYDKQNKVKEYLKGNKEFLNLKNMRNFIESYQKYCHEELGNELFSMISVLINRKKFQESNYLTYILDTFGFEINAFNVIYAEIKEDFTSNDNHEKCKELIKKLNEHKKNNIYYDKEILPLSHYWLALYNLNLFQNINYKYEIKEFNTLPVEDELKLSIENTQVAINYYIYFIKNDIYFDIEDLLETSKLLVYICYFLLQKYNDFFGTHSFILKNIDPIKKDLFLYLTDSKFDYVKEDINLEFEAFYKVGNGHINKKVKFVQGQLVLENK